MSNRVTESQLQAIVARINTLTNSPAKPYERIDGRLVGQIGNFHISGAYGGVCLHRMVNEGGGVSDVFSCGHVTKRELADRMYSFIRGLEFDKS